MERTERQERRGDAPKRDPLMTIAVVMSILVQLAGVVWWGGGISGNQAAQEKRMDKLEEQEVTRDAIVARHDTALAVLNTKLDTLKVSVDTTNQLLRTGSRP